MGYANPSPKWIFILLLFWPLYSGAEPAPLSLQDLTKVRQVISAEMSPDGDEIAFTMTKPLELYEDKDGEASREMYLVDSKGKIRPYLTGGDAIGLIRWSANSERVWFLAKRPGDRFVSIYAIAKQGGEARKVIRHEGNVQGFSLASDEKRLIFWSLPAKSSEELKREQQGFNAEVYEEDVVSSQLWVVDFNNGDSPVNKVTFDEHVLDAQLHPDGDTILVQSAPTALTDDIIMKKRLRLINLQGKELNRFEHVGKMGKILLSPDGDYVAIIGTNDPKDPAEGRLLLGRVEQPELLRLLKDFEGHVQDIAWLSDRRIGFIGHQGTESFLASKRVDNKPGSYKRLLYNAGILTRLSASENGNEIALVSHKASHPKEVYWYNRYTTRRVTDSNPWLADRTLAKQKTLRYTAQDGTELEGILVSPLTATKKPAPLILFVHGGPEAHFSNGWLNRYSHPVNDAASKGFVSFLPNYRGSTARGVAFSKLGQQDYAGAEFQDLLDAKRHLVELGLVDTNRAGITGASYGGYAAAWAATNMTEHFAASVATMGISNQLSKFGTTDIPTEMYQLHAMQWPWESWQWMLERSPLYHTPKARTPLLLLHGKRDNRVHYSQSMELYRYLKKLNQVPVRLVVYPNEGHGFRKMSARFDYSKRLMRWMEHFLIDGKSELPHYELDHPAEPMGQNQAGSK